MKPQSTPRLPIKWSSCLLPFLIAVTIGGLGIFTFQKYQRSNQLQDYDLEYVLRFTKNNKNKPLVEELFKLGNKVRDVRDLKSSMIQDEKKRKIHVLLNRICRDTCKTIRCRIDPGLGHACRINCPERRMNTCKLATKDISEKDISE